MRKNRVLAVGLSLCLLLALSAETALAQTQAQALARHNDAVSRYNNCGDMHNGVMTTNKDTYFSRQATAMTQEPTHFQVNPPTDAQGHESTAFYAHTQGHGHITYGDQLFAMGDAAYAEGNYPSAYGYYNTAFYAYDAAWEDFDTAAYQYGVAASSMAHWLTVDAHNAYHYAHQHSEAECTVW